MSPTRTPPMNGNEQKLLRGEGEGCHCRHAFSVQHRGDKFNTLNRCFIVDLSGARPRHWKSEFLAILQQMRCWMETFHHRNRRARRDVGQGNNSRTRCRSMRLIHSRRSRSRDDIAVSLAVPCGTQHHAVAFATTHEQRQRVLRIAIQNLEVRTRLARSANDFRRVARLVSDCIRLVQQSTSPRGHRVLHAIASPPRRAFATSSRSAERARPILEAASRTICSWTTTSAITSRPGLDQSTAVARTNHEQNRSESRNLINKSVSKVLTRSDPRQEK